MTARTRRELLRGLGSAAGAAATAGSVIATAVAQEGVSGESRMDQYDAGNTGHAPNERGPRSDPRQLWHSDTGEGLFGSPAIVDGAVYAASEAGTVRALDAVDGTERWSVRIDEGITSSPAVAAGTVYVAAEESLFALAADDGTENWAAEIGPDPSSPVVHDGLVAVAGGNRVHVFSRDGEHASASELTGEAVSTPAIVGSTLYVATDAGTVAAFEIERSSGPPDLIETWTTETVIDRRPTVSVADGTVVVTGASPGELDQGRVYALDAGTGEERWEFTTEHWIDGAAALDGESAYVGIGSGDLVALDAESGTERWRFDANDSWSFLYWGPGITGSPIVVGDTVYVGSEDDNLYAVDAESGTSQWRFSTGDAVVSTPTVVDGVAVVGNTAGGLYAITSPDKSPAPIEADADSNGSGTEESAEDAGTGGFLAGLTTSGSWGIVTSAVSLLLLTLGVLFAATRLALSGDTENSATDSPEDAEAATTAAEDSSHRADLLDELRELDERWSEMDRRLLYSVGEHHPDEYEAAFGTLDAALAAAGVREVDKTSDDDADDGSTTADGAAGDDATDGDAAEAGAGDHSRADDETSEDDTISDHEAVADITDGDPTDTTPATTSDPRERTPDTTDMTDLSPNELAELYAAFDRFQRLLNELANELDTEGTTPMEEWADAVFDHWAEGGPDGAPNYGVQQRDRNDFSIREYRDAYGDGERVTEFHHVEFGTVDDRVRHLLGDAIEDWDHAVPVAPDSNIPLPVAIGSAEALESGVELLGEFPAYPDADRPAPDETDDDTGGRDLPEGRVESLTVTVRDHDPNPGPKRDARLRVELADGTEIPLDVWTTHDLSLDWTVGATYTIEQARHKSWQTGTGTSHQLSSTKDLRVSSADPETGGCNGGSPSPNRTTGESGTTASRSTRGSTRNGRTPSRSELREAIRSLANAVDRPLKATDVDDATEYAANDVTRVFGSWQNGLAAAGVDNEARLVADLHRVADELGHRPSTSEMNEHGHVSATTYANYFGTYTAAVEQAFDEPETGRERTETGSSRGAGSDEPDREPISETGASAGEPATEDGDGDTVGGAESPGVGTEDDGILGDIEQDFEGLSGSESE
ncbi:hypothetical protein GCM10027435_16970 [Haloparvum alkalitolerans]|uniref:outer membrane protein assembly factor BamB family protein n=1 Tax=Haloparvum alkalitolerans TaxID=1042953 RepID=UPI003CF7D51C